jgi:hypothetical protein
MKIVLAVSDRKGGADLFPVLTRLISLVAIRVELLLGMIRRLIFPIGATTYQHIPSYE